MMAIKMKTLSFMMIIIALISSSQTQTIPEVSCPEIFSYYVNTTTNQTEGRINVVDIQLDKQNSILVKLTYPPFIVHDHSGSIEFAKSKEKIMQDIQKSLPVVYKIDFPTANPLPVVQEITHNGRTICNRQNPQRLVSEITLNFFFKIPKVDLTEITETVNKDLKLNDTRACGVSSTPISSLIRGNSLQPGSWPWLAGVYKVISEKKLRYHCGATVIAPNAVISVAHCFLRINLPSDTKNFRIGLGIFDQNNLTDSNVIIAQINELVIHPHFGKTGQLHDADIALITLDKDYTYNSRIQPICMWLGSANPNEIENEEGLTASFTEDNENNSILKVYTLEIVSSDTCIKSNSAYQNRVSTRNFCAGYLNGQGPCYGDSGQGLMIAKNEKLYLRGVVVGNLKTLQGACDLSHYTVYSDVAKFRSWIKSYVDF